MTFVDTNVILDVVSGEPRWSGWSTDRLRFSAAQGPLLINDVIYAEMSVRFSTIEALDDEVARLRLIRTAAPAKALFLAAKAFRDYRRADGLRVSLMPDFFIGAQAFHTGAPLLTRDTRRYRTYFPALQLISP